MRSSVGCKEFHFKNEKLILKKNQEIFILRKSRYLHLSPLGPRFHLVISGFPWIMNNPLWSGHVLSKVLPTHCYLLQAPLLPVTYSTMRFSCHFLSDLHWFHSSTLQSLVQWCWILHIFESLTLKFTHTGLIIIHKTLKKHSSCIYEFYEKRHD